jgi:predicted metal-dependent hydrolase
LLTLPRDLGEFVIVYELVHLLAPNHGRAFKPIRPIGANASGG